MSKNKQSGFQRGNNNVAKRPEVREKLSKKAKERIEKYGHLKRTLGKHWKVKDSSKMNKDKIGKHTWNYRLTKETDERVNNISKKLIGRKMTTKAIDKAIATKKKTGAFKKHSKFMKLRWANKEYKDNQIKKRNKGNRIKQNKK